MNILKPNLLKIFDDFFHHQADLSGVNVSHITLLPKKETPLEIKDFRPISLLHSIPKFLSKVLANRLQAVIQNLIDPMQSAFIKNRSIIENFLLASDLLQCALKRKKPMIALKLNFHKAFDTINFDCLYSALSHRGFKPRWIRYGSNICWKPEKQTL